MATWPQGHRWEDYRVDILDNTLATIGSLGTCHKLSGMSRLFGAYGGRLTFSLAKDDPWASILNESKIHFVKVWRDGTAIFSGYQVKHERKDNQDADLKTIEFEFLPLAHMAKWRFGKPVAPATNLSATDHLDNAMKWVVERTLGATAPAAPTTATARAVPNFVVAANKSEYPSDALQLDATYRNIYELFQRLGNAYEIDWDIYLNASNYPEFETWYPRRGSDKSEGNGALAEIILTDEHGMFTEVNYAVDTVDTVTVVYDGMMAHDVAASAANITNWWARDCRIEPYDVVTMTTTLNDHLPKISCSLEGFIELPNLRWDPAGTADVGFVLGDLITWRSLRMGYGPTDDVICGIDWEIDEQGYERLTLHLGDPKPDVFDQLRGGGVSRWTDDDDGTWLPWGIKGDAGTKVKADPATNAIQIHSDTVGYAFTEDVPNYQIDFTGPWTRNVNDLYLAPTTVGDGIRVYNATGLSLNITGDGDIIGNAQAAGGAANRYLDLKDYDIGTSAGGVAAGIHNINFSGDILSESAATGSVISFLAGGASHDVLWVREWTVWGEEGHSTLRADYTTEYGLRLVDTDGSTPVFTVAPTTGNSVWKAGATWTIEGDTYTLPTAFPASTGMALTGTDAGVLTWAAPAPAAHDIVGAAHTVTGSALQVVGLSGADTLGLLTPSADPGAAASLLASDASGHLELVQLNVGSANNYVGFATTTLILNGNTATYLAVGGTNEIAVGATSMEPVTDSHVSLGVAGKCWSNLYSDEAEIGGITITTHHHHYDKANTPTGAGSSHSHTIRYTEEDTTGGPGHEHRYNSPHSDSYGGTALTTSSEAAHTHPITTTSTNSGAAQD